MTKTINGRSSEYPIDDIFLKRYSPRALSGESITNEELMTLFEAAHWAPSAYNSQPWRFIYAMRDTPEFELFMSFLVDFNKTWCKNASVLIVTLSKKLDDKGNPAATHPFSTGSAWENLALQAASMGLVAHGMSGFDYDLVRQKLNIPEDYNVVMMGAVGKLGSAAELPDYMQAGEKPNDRKPLSEVVFQGKFPQ